MLSMVEALQPPAFNKGCDQRPGWRKKSKEVPFQDEQVVMPGKEGATPVPFIQAVGHSSTCQRAISAVGNAPTAKFTRKEEGNVGKIERFPILICFCLRSLF